jgi:hypothetical protein
MPMARSAPSYAVRAALLPLALVPALAACGQSGSPEALESTAPSEEQAAQEAARLKAEAKAKREADLARFYAGAGEPAEGAETTRDEDIKEQPRFPMAPDGAPPPPPLPGNAPAPDPGIPPVG